MKVLHSWQQPYSLHPAWILFSENDQNERVELSVKRRQGHFLSTVSLESCVVEEFPLPEVIIQYLISHSRFLFHEFFQSPYKMCELLANTACRDNDFHSSAVHYNRNYQHILCHPKLALNHKKGQYFVWLETWVLLQFGCYSNKFSTINLRTRFI